MKEVVYPAVLVALRGHVEIFPRDFPTQCVSGQDYHSTMINAAKVIETIVYLDWSRGTEIPCPSPFQLGDVALVIELPDDMGPRFDKNHPVNAKVISITPQTQFIELNAE